MNPHGTRHSHHGMSATRKNLKPIEDTLDSTDLNIPDTVATMALTPLGASTEALFAILPAGSLQSREKKISKKCRKYVD